MMKTFVISVGNTSDEVLAVGPVSFINTRVCALYNCKESIWCMLLTGRG